MDFSVNQRIRELRKKIGLNQRDFCKMLALSTGYIAGVEINSRKVNDRLIKLIIAEFKVNEEWLRYGNGEMFREEPSNEKAARISSLYDDLPPHYQDVVLGTIELLRKANEVEKSLR
jgi:transcriptional regulator with XRE-family HTH domain